MIPVAYNTMKKTKILIVDDHRVVIEGIKSALEGHSEFEVVGEALNGREAVKLSQSLRPDIVIMDISMPDLNGIDATLQIKKLSPDIQIVIFSMYANREYVIDLFMAGISAYVLKDDPLSELILALKAVCGSGTYFSTMAPRILASHLRALKEEKKGTGGFENLSLREREVLQPLAEGKSIKEIAGKLYISPRTVESHKYRIMSKLNAQSLADLVKIAIRKNLTPL